MVLLKKAELADSAVLQELAKVTFTETFGHDNSPEQLEAYFEEAYAILVLEAELASPESLTYIAWEGEEAIGYLKVNWGSQQTEQELENGFEVQRIYVLKSHQGTGLGKKLFEKALELADESGQDWVWLGVWEHNSRAQAFYKKYGFEKFSEHAFPVGDKIDVDWLMKKEIRREN